MKLFRNWFRPKPHKNIDVRESNAVVDSVTVEEKRRPRDEYSDEASFGWRGNTRGRGCNIDFISATDSIPDDSPTVPVLTISMDDNLSCSAGNDVGYDPYDTGRFSK